MSTVGDSLRSAVAKLRRVQRVRAAQWELDSEVGQLVLVKNMGKPMSDLLRKHMEEQARTLLAERGHKGVTVEAIYHLEKRLVEFRAHAEDKR